MNLTDIIDIDSLQKLQDIFAKTMNISIIIVDDDGPVTKSSDFSDFCKYTKTLPDANVCNNYDIGWEKAAVSKGEAVTYICNTGLINFVIPIIVNGKHFGSIFGGPVLTEPPREEELRKIAQELGINEDDYIMVVKKLKIISKNNLETAINLLQLLANAIFEVGLKNLKSTEYGKQEIALREVEFHKETQRQITMERLLRKIFETIRSSLDINIIKNKIVTEIGKELRADICFIALYDLVDDCFYSDEYSEYLSSPEIKSYVGTSNRDPKFKWFTDTFKNKIDINFANVEKFIEENNLQNTSAESLLREYNIKSGYCEHIYYANSLLGYIIFYYTKDYRELDKCDLEFLEIIATQSGIALYQANLYQTIQIQAEREKISRNIIEILRSTLDKNTIKHLFVKNIGNFFDADVVIFSEFNRETNMYSPIDKNSEYLSAPDIKSFVGYDWSHEEIREYVQPLLEKREFHIYNWDEYIHSNSKSQNFINLFENMGVKSSYSFPVISQEKIMGFFSIQFIKNVHKLSYEDIKRVRNICTQAGIAFYHADLYEEAQKSAQAHNEFVNKLSGELKDSLNMIIDFSEMKSENELQCKKEVEHLNDINNNAKKLRFLLENIIENAKTKMDFK